MSKTAEKTLEQRVEVLESQVAYMKDTLSKLFISTGLDGDGTVKVVATIADDHEVAEQQCKLYQLKNITGIQSIGQFFIERDAEGKPIE